MEITKLEFMCESNAFYTNIGLIRHKIPFFMSNLKINQIVLFNIKSYMAIPIHFYLFFAIIFSVVNELPIFKKKNRIFGDFYRSFSHFEYIKYG